MHLNVKNATELALRIKLPREDRFLPLFFEEVIKCEHLTEKCEKEEFYCQLLNRKIEDPTVECSVCNYFTPTYSLQVIGIKANSADISLIGDGKVAE